MWPVPGGGGKITEGEQEGREFGRTDGGKKLRAPGSDRGGGGGVLRSKDIGGVEEVSLCLLFISTEMQGF